MAKTDIEKGVKEAKDEYEDGADPDPPNGPLHDLVIGYPKLAGRMSVVPQTAAFRRFGALNARNLLYLQSELIDLEADLKKAERQDSLNDKGRKKKYAVDHRWLLRSNLDGDTEQLDLFMKIRAKLKEYNEALIQQTAICQMKEPDSYDINDIQCFMSNRAMGPRALIGPDRKTWGCCQNTDGYSRELVCIYPRDETDPFSEWLASHSIKLLFGCGFGRFLKPDKASGVQAVDANSVYKLTFGFTSIIASLIPMISIIVLVCVTSTAARIGTIGAFNILISVCLSVFTDARRTDVFAVTAAFAAVQVVFVGTDNASGSKGLVVATNGTCTC